MKIIRCGRTDFEDQLRPLFQRVSFDTDIEDQVAEILAEVREDGDEACVRFARLFDSVTLVPSEFRVAEEELADARGSVTEVLRDAVELACRQVGDFSLRGLPESRSYNLRDGVVAGERFSPLDRVGVYVPGGTAPLISTVIHTVKLASVAGVGEIAVVTPPGPDGRVHPAILYAARIAGATEVYRLGGVYGIGALAYGTQTVPKVEKIVGPGNAYVTAAKRQVYGHVSLDLVAGPSEIMIIADDSADPVFVAADMLSQAEHGSGHEQAVLVTVSPDLLAAVREQLVTQSRGLNRRECIEAILGKGVFLVQVESLDQAVDVANRYAAEHLEIMTEDPDSVLEGITAAGAVFLGPWTPEPVGDFVAGPSHVLPTGGAARRFSGLTVTDFFRRMSVVSYRRNALNREIAAIETIASAEGLDGHVRSVSVRKKQS